MSDEIAEEIRRELLAYRQVLMGKRVFVELPEGLKRYESVVESVLRELNAVPVFRLEPVYGACDTLACEASRYGFQVVLHFGHYPYPLSPVHECNGTRVVYIPVRLGNVDEHAADQIASSVADVVGEDSVAIGYVPQLERHVQSVVKVLQAKGVKVVAVTPILGCYFYNLEEVDVGAFLVFGGRFHALGLGLAVHGEKRILVVEDSRVVDYTREVQKVLRVRYGKVLEASGARSWGIILGLYPGQYRPGLVDMLRDNLIAKGYTVRIYASMRTLIRDLDAIRDVDAFVVTSCPRLAIEDAADYDRPVLTPGEVLYLLGVYDRIRFPW